MESLKIIVCAIMLLVFKKTTKAATAPPPAGSGSSGGGSSGGGSSGGGSSGGSGSSGGGSSGSGSSGGSSGGGSSGGYGCGQLLCPTCPDGYQVYHEYVNSCPTRCLCELSGLTTESNDKRLSKSLLLSILHNLQNNAGALEQMAKGLSDEADLAQDAADLS